MTSASTDILFHDSMASDWQENWFLDGKHATLEHRDLGLSFAAGTISKAQDAKRYHDHHAVLWTKREFAGDIAVSFDMTRVDASNYGAVLIYLQAQGIGAPPHVQDIFAWRELRESPAMSSYFNYMNLYSLSLRETINCKRYPWNDVATGVPYQGVLMEPKHAYAQPRTGETFRVEIEKRNPFLTIRLRRPDSGAIHTECTWDMSVKTDDRQPRLVEQGRIGIRHMSTRQVFYRNFTVRRL